jgi:hypothetical protein
MIIVFVIVIIDCAYSNSPSNWVESGTGQAWLNGSGVYSGDHQV